MKKAFLKMVILLLMMGSGFPGFSQEKNIKMEVFEKIEEVLPFTAVDKNGCARCIPSRGNDALGFRVVGLEAFGD
jgi:hypothetical protein